jgi:hypothetical protein
MQRHMASQTTPSATGLCHPITRAQLQLAADMIHLGLLGRLEAHLLVGKISAGVLHLGIEPQPVKIVADVIVVVNVLSRTIGGIGAGLALLQSLYQLYWPPHLSDTSKRLYQEPNQIAFDRNTATGKSVTKTYFPVTDQLHQRRLIVNGGSG